MKNLLFIIFFLFFTKEALSEDHYLCAFESGFIMGENLDGMRKLEEPFLFKYRLVIDKGYISSDMYFKGKLIGKIKKTKRTDGLISLGAENKKNSNIINFSPLNRTIFQTYKIEGLIFVKNYICRKD